MKRCRAFQLDTNNQVDVVKSVCRMKVRFRVLNLLYVHKLSQKIWFSLAGDISVSDPLNLTQKIRVTFAMNLEG